MSETKERIVLDVAYQPQVRIATDTPRLMLDVIIALCPAAVWGIIQFGWNVLILIASSVCSAVFFEWAYRKLMKKDNSIGDLSACVTGLLLALVLPASAAAAAETDRPWCFPEELQSRAEAGTQRVVTSRG